MRRYDPESDDQRTKIRNVHEKRLANVMENAAAEYEAERDAAREARLRYERQQTAIRQFLLFLVFFILASLVIYRNPIGQWLSSLDKEIGLNSLEQKVSDTVTQKKAVGKVSQKIQNLSDEADRRNKLIEQIQ